MSNKKILVLGATGAQGGSVARHLLASGDVTVRCLTRNPNSDKATALASAGAELVKGDLDSIDTLFAAAKGCYGVFAVTNFWEHMDQNKEFQQGKNVVDAVSQAGAGHLVFSTLPYVNKITKGALDVPHFDGKGQIEEYVRGTGISATYLHVAFYYENWFSFFPPQKQEDGSYSFGFPQGDTRMAAVAVEDVGGVAAGIFQDPARFRDSVVGAVGDDLPPAMYARIMSQVLGVRVNYNYIPREVFASFDFPGADDLANMFEYNRLHIPDRQTDLEEANAIYPKIQNFETWLKANKNTFNLT